MSNQKARGQPQKRKVPTKNNIKPTSTQHRKSKNGINIEYNNGTNKKKYMEKYPVSGDNSSQKKPKVNTFVSKQRADHIQLIAEQGKKMVNSNVYNNNSTSRLGTNSKHKNLNNSSCNNNSNNDKMVNWLNEYIDDVNNGYEESIDPEKIQNRVDIYNVYTPFEDDWDDEDFNEIVDGVKKGVNYVNKHIEEKSRKFLFLRSQKRLQESVCSSLYHENTEDEEEEEEEEEGEYREESNRNACFSPSIISYNKKRSQLPTPGSHTLALSEETKQNERLSKRIKPSPQPKQHLNHKLSPSSKHENFDKIYRYIMKGRKKTNNIYDTLDLALTLNINPYVFLERWFKFGFDGVIKEWHKQQGLLNENDEDDIVRIITMIIEPPLIDFLKEQPNIKYDEIKEKIHLFRTSPIYGNLRKAISLIISSKPNGYRNSIEIYNTIKEHLCMIGIDYNFYYDPVSYPEDNTLIDINNNNKNKDNVNNNNNGTTSCNYDTFTRTPAQLKGKTIRCFKIKHNVLVDNYKLRVLIFTSENIDDRILDYPLLENMDANQDNTQLVNSIVILKAFIFIDN